MDDRTKELCRRASTEQDGEKLSELVAQIIESLNKKDKRSAQPQPPLKQDDVASY